MATQTFTAFTPEIWSPRVNFFFKTKLTAAPFFEDYSSDVSDGGDIIHIPNVADSFSTSDVQVTNGVVTKTNLSDTNTNLTVDNWKAVAYDLTDFQFAQIMKSFNVRNAYAMAMGHSLAKKFDLDLLAEGANLTATVGTSGTSLVATNIEAAFGILASNSIPKEDAVFFVAPKVYWQDIMSIQKYYDASQFGKPSVPQGAHDLLYGVPVVLTNQLPSPAGGGITNLLVHRRAFVYANAALPNMSKEDGTAIRIQEKPSESLKVQFIGDMAYGMTTLNANAGVKVYSDT